MAETRVGILVPNLFLRVPVDTAVRGVGALPVILGGSDEARHSDCRIVIIDLEAAGETGPDLAALLAGTGKIVLAFGPHVESQRLAAARAAGAVALARGAFLARLPELLSSALERIAGEE